MIRSVSLLSLVLNTCREITNNSSTPSPVTSSVTYCSEPDALLIQQFDVAYFQQNSSIWFNISAASVVSSTTHSFPGFNHLPFVSAGTQRQRVRQHLAECLWNTSRQLYTRPLLFVQWCIMPIANLQFYWIGFHPCSLFSWRKRQNPEHSFSDTRP